MKPIEAESNYASRLIKVLFLEPEAYSDSVRAEIPIDWDCHFLVVSSESELLKCSAIESFDVIFGRLGLTFGKSFFDAFAGAKILATPTTGLDHVDLDAAEMAGVHLLSLRHEYQLLENITSTAEHAWTLLLASNRLVPELVRRTQAGSWMRSDLALHQLSGQKIGIIGMGRLGRMIAEYARAFRMHVLAYDPLIPGEQFPEFITDSSLQEVLVKSDHIIVAASYSSGDPMIMGRDEVLSMKQGCTFVNIARGELVDELALVEAVERGVCRAVAVDVLQGDPHWSENITVSSPLIEKAKECERIIITPHVGGYATEAIDLTRRFLLDQVKQLIQKESGGNKWK